MRYRVAWRQTAATRVAARHGGRRRASPWRKSRRGRRGGMAERCEDKRLAKIKRRMVSITRHIAFMAPARQRRVNDARRAARLSSPSRHIAAGGAGAAHLQYRQIERRQSVNLTIYLGGEERSVDDDRGWRRNRRNVENQPGKSGENDINQAKRCWLDEENCESIKRRSVTN